MSETRELKVCVGDPQSMAECLSVIFEQTNGLTEGLEALTVMFGMAVTIANARPEISLAQGLSVVIDAAIADGQTSPVLSNLRHCLNTGGEFTPPPNPGKRFHIVAGDRKAA